MSAPMGRFRIERNESYDDPAVICNDCDETVCTVEDGDTLELIWSVGQDHECDEED